MVDGNLAMNYQFENMSEADDNAAYEAHFIKKGNKAIAVFMDMLKKDGEHLHLWVKKVEDFIGESCPTDIDVLCEKLQYHSSWGRLMPVVEKIVAIRYEGDETAYLRTFGMRNHDGNYMVRFNWCSLHEADTLLWATYSAVVDFIEMQTAKNSEQKAE